MTDVTKILKQIKNGESAASEILLPLVYDELRKLASIRLANEKPGQTLQATALVHEAYLRLLGNDPKWDSQGHFFGAAAEAMRRILIEQARKKKSIKEGGEFQRISLSQVDANPERSGIDLVDLDVALEKLESNHPRKAKLVKLRYFAGLTIAQAAEALEIATSTADADWAYAKGWLQLELEKDLKN